MKVDWIDVERGCLSVKDITSALYVVRTVTVVCLCWKFSSLMATLQRGKCLSKAML